MRNKIALSLLVAVTMVVAAIPLSARSCILSNVASEKACQPGCCANKMCCESSGKNTAAPSQPLAKADFGMQPNATCFVAVALPSPSCEAVAEQLRFLPASPRTNSAPRLALLCTFLI